MPSYAQKLVELIKGNRLFGGANNPLGHGPLYLEKRLNPRVITNISRIVRVYLKGGLLVEVHDISFGGIALRLDRYEIGKYYQNPRDVTLTLVINGRSLECRAALIHCRKGISSFSFIHHNDLTLVFLRPFMECGRIGRTFKESQVNETDLEIHGPNYKTYVGEMDCGIRIWRSFSQTIEQCQLTSIVGSEAITVSYVDGKITLGDSQIPESKDLAALEQSLFLLVGMLEHLKINDLVSVAEAIRETTTALSGQKS